MACTSQTVQSSADRLSKFAVLEKHSHMCAGCKLHGPLGATSGPLKGCWMPCTSRTQRGHCSTRQNLAIRTSGTAAEERGASTSIASVQPEPRQLKALLKLLFNLQTGAPLLRLRLQPSPKLPYDSRNSRHWPRWARLTDSELLSLKAQTKQTRAVLQGLEAQNL